MRFLLIVLFVLTADSTAQPNLMGSLVLNYPVAAADRSVYEYWRPGITVGLSADFPIADHFNIEPMLSYQYLLFDEYVQNFFGTATVVDSRADASVIVQTGAALIVQGSEESAFTPQLILGAGFQWVTIGSMTLTWRDLDGSIEETQETPSSRDTWYITLGGGLEFRATDRLFVQTTIRSITYLDYLDFGTHEVSPYETSINDWIVGIIVKYAILE